MYRLLLPLRHGSIIVVSLLLATCAAKQKTPTTAKPVPSAGNASASAKAEYLVSQGGLALAEGDTENALAYYLEAARVLEAAGQDTVEQADAHYEAANVAYQRLERELAVEEYDKALAIYLRYSGNAQAKAAVTLTNMGVVYKEISDTTRARSCWEKALEIYNKLPEELQSQRNIAKIRQNIRDMDQGLY